MTLTGQNLRSASVGRQDYYYLGCKLIDLGNWVDGRYQVAGESTTPPDADAEDAPPDFLSNPKKHG